jgi:nuclear pore complex protein Nup133
VLNSAGATHSLVTDAIHTFTSSYPLPHPSASHDVVRDFFRYRAAEIGRLIPFMVERAENAGEGAMKEVGGAVVVSLYFAHFHFYCA